MELTDEIHGKILILCEIGDELLDENRVDLAITKYLSALELVPNPKSDWEASTWIYTTLGEVYLMKKEYKIAKEYFYNALNCPDGKFNPLILLRIGETLFETQDFEQSKEYLLRAYMLEGQDIFDEEDEKYFNSIKSLI
ncbi:tol-pal system YbgF family protein [Paenibacillus sp. sgz5001063]|uniref:tetratricopeptide repeat protein n=1 Tax=Paenibacillus sp. sgz5001063 TaxID=3242474 RepID=UPI0036D398B4